MARWVAGWLAVAGLVLIAARFVVQPVRDAWLFIGVARGGNVLVARYDVSNTGLFADQLTTRLALLRDEGSALAHRAISGPARIDENGVHGALDSVQAHAGGWSWSMGGESFKAQGRAAATATCPPSPGTFHAIVNVPDTGGAGGEGHTLQGLALLARTHAVGNVSGGALYAIDNAGALGLDPLAECPGFLRLGGLATRVATPWIPPDPEPSFSLTVAGHRISVRTVRQGYTEAALDHTLLPERWLAWAVGFRSPSVTLQRVKVRVDDAPAWNGILLLRDHTPPS